jgi:protein-L-isoaspartate(D-aspartate) O-methyltransferase
LTANRADPIARRSAILRRFYARYVAARAGVTDSRVIAAFAAVPREAFAGPGPWSVLAIGPWSDTGRYVRTPDADPAFLYHDTLIALDAARGINIGEPSLHARCLDALAIRPGQTALQVGAGSGYYTAILAELVGPGGRVHGYEIDPALAARATANLADRPWVSLHAGSGVADGLPQGDIVYVNAGLTQPSRLWLDALRPGGRLLFPLQPLDGYGGMLLVRRPKAGGTWPARFVCRAGFIACQARQDAATGRRLAIAFAGGDWTQVRSLRLDDAPDATNWCSGDGWWLSTDP